MASMQVCDGCSVGMRLLALLFCIASLVTLMKSKQTVQLSVGQDYVTQSVKYSDSSALIYLVFSNTLAGIYCIVSLANLIPTALGKGPVRKGVRWVIFILDQIMAYVLLAAASSATEVAYLAKNGMAKTSWEALCPTYRHFCWAMDASIGFSFAAVTLLAAISVISASKLFHLYTRSVYAMKMRHTSLT